MNGFWQDFTEWAAHPFSEDMDAKHWFYLLGMFIVFAFLWNILLYHLIEILRSAAQET